MMAIDSWQVAAAYDRYMGRWSRQLAPRFLQWLGMPEAQRWLDVGCGSGALSEAILEHGAPRAIIALDPSEGFLAMARSRLGDCVELHRAAAAQMPLPDAAVDVTVSCLVLNFVSDANAGLREMARVTANGGHVAACVWDYGGTMDLTRLYWDAAARLGLLAPGQDQGERFPICQTDALVAAFVGAGLREVEGAAINLPMRFADFDDYWQPFLGGQGSAPAHAMSLDDAARQRLRELLRETVPTRADGTLALAARAWAARGVVAK